jgi:hypothetical protein
MRSLVIIEKKAIEIRRCFDGVRELGQLGLRPGPKASLQGFGRIESPQLS